MNFRLHVRLNISPEQASQLALLQQVFVQACNHLAGLAYREGVWSRMGLHQRGYAMLRQQFPQLGSQMACNVIYSVSRAAKWAFHHPDSPVYRRAGPSADVRILFGHNAPVYFDRHTLSVRDGHASMYSLDGRLRFDLPLTPEDEHRLRHGGIREIALTRDDTGPVLSFHFAEASSQAFSVSAPEPAAPAALNGQTHQADAADPADVGVSPGWLRVIADVVGEKPHAEANLVRRASVAGPTSGLNSKKRGRVLRKAGAASPTVS